MPFYDVGSIRHPGWEAAEKNPEDYYFDAVRREHLKRHAVGARVSFADYDGPVFGTITGRDEIGYDCITWDDGARSVQRPGDPDIVPVR